MHVYIYIYIYIYIILMIIIISAARGTENGIAETARRLKAANGERSTEQNEPQRRNGKNGKTAKRKTLETGGTTTMCVCMYI